VRCALAGALLAGAGCAGGKHLVFTTYTKTGLDITVADGAPTEAVFGYKRFEGAVIPVDEESDTADAHSIYAGLCIENSWIKGLALGQVFATGEAAEGIASDSTRSEQAQRFLQCKQD
jgi:hypothetical protein